jgi:hypothetical protein
MHPEQSERREGEALEPWQLDLRAQRRAAIEAKREWYQNRIAFHLCAALEAAASGPHGAIDAGQYIGRAEGLLTEVYLHTELYERARGLYNATKRECTRVIFAALAKLEAEHERAYAEGLASGRAVKRKRAKADE